MRRQDIIPIYVDVGPRICPEGHLSYDCEAHKLCL